jgi:cytochrome c
MSRLGGKLGVVVALGAACALAGAMEMGIAAKEGSKKVSGDVAKGQSLFKQNCDLCHYADKTDKKLGPGLKGLFSWKELPSSHKPVTEENVRAQIETGSLNAKPMPMPPFKDKLKPAEMDALIAYLKTL